MYFPYEWRHRAAGAVLAALTLPAVAQDPAIAGTPERRALAAVEAVCGGADVHADGSDIVVDGASLAETSPLVVRGREIGVRRRFVVGETGEELLLETIQPGGLLRRVRSVYRAPVPGARGLLPTLMVVADGQCRVQVARRLLYDAAGKAEYIERMSPTLEAVEAREALNPPVPAPGDGAVRPAPDGPTVPVAVVDAGVNYLLPEIGERLARDADGGILGFDFWDMDARPFDAHPTRSPFFPQRHGTQTASLLLREAPVARLVPYRYPRPDMSRMIDLIEAAAEAGLVVFNLSLGSDGAEDWAAFKQAAAAHPDMLFVVSAGNNGRDIDSQPVYPASLALDNMLVVSSALPDGRPAQGSNWGRQTVDLLVPAEEVLVTDFHGHPKVVSGSSYAAARVSALAACLLAQNPEWRSEILKAAILEQVRTPDGDTGRYSRYGFLPDPGARLRGACAALPRQVVESSREVWTREDLGDATPAASLTHALRPTMVILEDSGWKRDEIRPAAAKAVQILAQCGVDVPEITVRLIEAPERMSIFRNDWSTELVSELAPEKPAVFFVRDSLVDTGFHADAYAIGRSNGRRWPRLVDTVWVMAGAQDLGIGLAHEIYHAIADTGQHDPDPANLMHGSTSGSNTILRLDQCLRLVRVGEALGTLEKLD